jgi:hypothetical protein
MDVMTTDLPIDRYYGVKAGDLVRVNVPPGGARHMSEDTDEASGVITGVVLDVWPANVYEHSESVVLIGGYPDPHRITVRTSYLSLLETS